MGRCFSTVYRFFLAAFSISALVLSILSATSCQFVKFDHQYKSDSRWLFESKFGTGRSLQDDEDPEVAGLEDGAPDDQGAPTAGGAIVDPADEVADPADVPLDDEDLMEADLAGEQSMTGLGMTNGMDTGSNPAAGQDDPTADVPVDGPPDDEDLGEGADVVEDVGVDFSVPLDSGNEEATEQAPSAAPEPATEVETPVFGGADDTTPAAAPESPSSGGAGDEDDEDDADSKPSSSSGSGTTGGNGSAPYGSSQTAPNKDEPVAQLSGDAGLFCEGEFNLDVVNKYVWGKSVAQLEEEIDERSDLNQSEEIARNAVLAASVLGSVAAFVIVMECLIGWRIWCEKIIIGLVSLAACISQGITFLFFNSQRYCDGDIINEILNQEPCVVGQGALYSIIALVLYAIMLVMSCRLPQDDPYSVCCKKRNRESDAGGSSSGQFGLISGKGSAVDDPNSKPERPNWLSEEGKPAKEGEEEEEDAII